MNSKKIFVLGIAFAVFVVSLFFDDKLLSLSQSVKAEPLTLVFTAFTEIGTLVGVLFVIASVVMWKKKRDWVIPLWLSLAITIAVTYILKFLIARPRPVTLGAASLLAISGYSFPSAHASASFSGLPVLSREFKKLRYLWIIAAVLIALSRLYLGVHYASDVIFGALLGYCTGLFCLWLKKRQWFKKVNFLVN